MVAKVEVKMGRGSVVSRQKLVGSTAAMVAAYREDEIIVTEWPQW